MRYKVPQNIDMQDRIIGPLTMVQFIYAVVGGGICYAIFMSGLPKLISYALIIPIGIFVMALVFVKINERPFLDFFLSVLEYTMSPRNRTWKHDPTDMEVEVYKARQAQQQQVITTNKFTHEQISSLAKQIDESKL